MARRSDKVYLGDILDSIEQVQGYLTGITFEEFVEAQLLQDAVVMRLHVIGEASRQLSHAFRTSHSQVEWSKIIGLRNRIAHEYFDIDPNIVWDAVRQDLPYLHGYIKTWFSEAADDL